MLDHEVELSGFPEKTGLVRSDRVDHHGTFFVPIGRGNAFVVKLERRNAELQESSEKASAQQRRF